MPFPFLAAAAVVSVGASIFGGISAKKDSDAAAKQQEELARANAKYIGQEGAEQTRRTLFEQKQVRGTVQAISAGTGLGGGRSRSAYQQMMLAQHGKELDWIKKSVTSRQDIAIRGGGMAADATRAAGSAALFGGIGSAIGTIGSAAAGGAFGSNIT